MTVRTNANSCATETTYETGLRDDFNKQIRELKSSFEFLFYILAIPQRRTFSDGCSNCNPEMIFLKYRCRDE